MLGTSRIATFVCTRDRATAKAFYGETLGLALVHEDDYAAVFDCNGIALRISTVKELVPQPFTVLGWNVTDIEETARAMIAKGIAFERVPGLQQDDIGIWSPAPGVKVAWFKDPDGNWLSIAQH
ncbi:MAG TPA: VOC family protein [Rhizomicrobium sp.]|jgi:catechol 2,3-dioxygenase-like lactoylglutathione lyase family enzyme